MKNWFVICTVVMLLGGWSFAGSHDEDSGKTSLQSQVDSVRQSIEQKNWRRAAHGAHELRQMYDQKEWKLQLLGDESEYEGLQQDIARLQAAVKARDKANAFTELADIEVMISNIYSY
ncbi:MAG TPA: DUF4363 family protein [Bacillales bacterium]|nr:DUF4363 family protein [Bacillales bacterium]